MKKQNTYGKISIVSAGLAIPVGLFASLLATWVLKSRNAANINVSSEIAYLTEILAALVATFVIIWSISLIAGLLGRKKDTDGSFAKLGLLLLAINSVLAIGLISVNRAADKVSNPQKTEQLEKLFDSVEAQ